ncbi:hypothetical protein DVH02_28765 [Streptomyces corynorhini]|uniref:Uncharacterized protein n=1 Tax=Streptomyces corynorhini TaxID=2282652 RepID=A0A370B320_9ACTN|nr:hypothetical protein DVH02_28765 [Streptomyces corynorhini]
MAEVLHLWKVSYRSDGSNCRHGVAPLYRRVTPIVGILAGLRIKIGQQVRDPGTEGAPLPRCFVLYSV